MPHKQPPKEHQFSSTNQPEHQGRKKGTKNFSTRVKELLAGISQDNDWTSPIAAEKVKIVFSKNDKGKYIYPPEIRNRVMNDILERTEGSIKQGMDITHSGSIDKSVNPFDGVSVETKEKILKLMEKDNDTSNE